LINLKGGFSIRNVRKAKEHIAKHGPTYENEDWKFVEWCNEDPDCFMCPIEVGHEFAVEGFHEKAWAFHNNYSYSALSSCPFNDTIADLNRMQPRSPYNPPSEDWQPKVTVRIQPEKIP
jgi:hypothetical protein